jgi:hypothetical protein
MISLLAGLLITPPVHAQQVSLTVNPPLYHTIIQPGKNAILPYSITNLGDPTNFTVKMVQLAPDSNGNLQKVKTTKASTIQFKLNAPDIVFDTPFLLRSKETKYLVLETIVPENIKEQDYYYGIQVTALPQPPKEGIVSTRISSGEISSLFLTVSKTGEMNQKSSISLFDVKSRFKLTLFGKNYHLFDTSDPIPVILMMHNTGRNLINVDGEVRLSPSFDNKIIYPLSSQSILSQSQKVLVSTLSKYCERYAGDVLCKTPHTTIISPLSSGYYNLSASVQTENQDSVYYDLTSFIVIPIQFTLFILGLIWMAIVLIIVGGRMGKKSK